MPANPNLFIDTLAQMDGGDTLILLGGSTFPGENKTAKVGVGMTHIIPILHIATGRDEYAPRENPVLDPDDEKTLMLELERNDTRFGHDYGEGPDISFGKGAGTILGQTVDIVILGSMSQNPFYFIGKPSE